MKNLKNIIAATGLAAILMMSATTAQAGLLMSDRAEANSAAQCTEDTGLLARLEGIIVIGFAGLLMSDAPSAHTDCEQNTVSVSPGIVLGD